MSSEDQEDDDTVYEPEDEGGESEEDRKPAAVDNSSMKNRGETVENRNAAKKKRKKRKNDEIVWDKPNKEEYKGPRVNWNTLAGRKWVSESVLKYLPHPEIAKLIGWAHYGTHDGSTATKDTKEGEATNPKATRISQEPNPLLEIEPDSPLPHSHLDFIQEKMRDLVRGKPDNPHVSKAKVMDESLECILESFDTSAAVALGMVLEEMITANLLPLAEAHVQRCRQLEHEEEERNKELQKAKSALPSNYENPSFQQWTLPPEEAIFNCMVSSLKEDTSSTGNTPCVTSELKARLPSGCPPTRSLCPPKDIDASKQQAQAAAQFCQRQDLKPRFVQNNMDVHQFFTSLPPDEDANTIKKRRKNHKKGEI